MYYYDELKYHSSWSWQIPVYSKLMKAFVERGFYSYSLGLEFEYNKAVKDNDPLKAFEIIVENLNWYNKNKNGK